MYPFAMKWRHWKLQNEDFLLQGKGTVSLSAVAYLVSEIISYHKEGVTSVSGACNYSPSSSCAHAAKAKAIVNVYVVICGFIARNIPFDLLCA